MTHFRKKPGTNGAMRQLKTLIPDVRTFTSVVRMLVVQNPLGCTAYYARKRAFPPVMPVRERYTAKFVYYNGDGKQVGTSSEVYDSAEGYETGSAAMITNMANIAAHRGRATHRRDADLFSVILKCHDCLQGFYFVTISRDRITVSSFMDQAIRRRVEEWADSVPELQ